VWSLAIKIEQHTEITDSEKSGRISKCTLQVITVLLVPMCMSNNLALRASIDKNGHDSWVFLME
jgi:hypothetical protein